MVDVTSSEAAPDGPPGEAGTVGGLAGNWGGGRALIAARTGGAVAHSGVLPAHLILYWGAR
jgi:hypothetical protein